MPEEEEMLYVSMKEISMDQLQDLLPDRQTFDVVYGDMVFRDCEMVVNNNTDQVKEHSFKFEAYEEIKGEQHAKTHTKRTSQEQESSDKKVSKSSG